MLDKRLSRRYPNTSCTVLPVMRLHGPVCCRSLLYIMRCVGPSVIVWLENSRRAVGVCGHGRIDCHTCGVVVIQPYSITFPKLHTALLIGSQELPAKTSGVRFVVLPLCAEDYRGGHPTSVGHAPHNEPGHYAVVVGWPEVAPCGLNGLQAPCCKPLCCSIHRDIHVGTSAERGMIAAPHTTW